MSTKRVSLVVACMAAAVALLTPAAFGSPVELKLSIDGKEFPVGEHVQATVALANVSDKPLTTAVMLNEDDGKSLLSFEVRNVADKTGGQLPYCGAQWQMSFECFPVHEIPAGGQVEQPCRVTDLYHLYQPGEYEVRAVYRQLEQRLLDRYKKVNVLPEVLRSEPVRITITDKNRIFQNTLEVPYEEKDENGNTRTVVSRLTLSVYKTSAGNRVYYECSRPADVVKHMYDGITALGTIVDGTWPVFAVEQATPGQNTFQAVRVLLMERKGQCRVYVLRPDGQKESAGWQAAPPKLEDGIKLVQWKNGEVATLMQ